MKNKVKKIREKIDEFSKQPSKVKLVAVTKNIGVRRIKRAVEAGIQHIGENKIQEAERKLPKIKNLDVTKHFIGHLQSNKAKKAVKMFDYIHSIDSIKIAEKINRECQKQKKKIKALIQVNVSGEKTKYGFRNGDLGEVIKETKKLKNIDVVGLMTLAPFIKPEYTRPHFQKLKKMAKNFNLKELSMGMSNDYKVALEEGSTMIRVGTALFK